jgi:hypothetical protein
MSYLSVITLERAKNYLRIDPDLTEDDAEITSMINASLRYAEQRTRHFMYARDIVYNGSCQVKVYDYPINSVVAPTDPLPWSLTRSLYTIYPDNKTVTLNVGYTDPADVPDIFIQSALQMIKVWYYEAEKQVNSQMIPISVTEALDVEKRFL